VVSSHYRSRFSFLVQVCNSYFRSGNGTICPLLSPTELSRHKEVYIGGSGYANSTLMTSPRLRGLFGANNNGSNKKSHPLTMSKPDKSEFPSTTTIPPTTPCLSFHSNHFPGRNTNSNSNSLPQCIPRSLRYHAELPHRTRFDIGAWSRSPMTLLHSSSSSHPQSPPQLPSVVVEEWCGVAKMRDTAATGTTVSVIIIYPLTHQGSLGKTSLIKHRF